MIFQILFLPSDFRHGCCSNSETIFKINYWTPETKSNQQNLASPLQSELHCIQFKCCFVIQFLLYLCNSFRSAWYFSFSTLPSIILTISFKEGTNVERWKWMAWVILWLISYANFKKSLHYQRCMMEPQKSIFHTRSLSIKSKQSENRSFLKKFCERTKQKDIFLRIFARIKFSVLFWSEEYESSGRRGAEIVSRKIDLEPRCNSDQKGLLWRSSEK